MITLIHPETGEERTMHDRGDWRAAPRRGSPTWSPFIDRERLVLHHSTGDNSGSLERSYQLVRGIQNFHQAQRGWTDIAYNFLVDDLGNLIQGRGFFFQNGANNPSNNVTYSICYLGDGSRDFPDEAKRTVRWLFSYLNAPVAACPGGCGFSGHRDEAPTICPGELAYEWILNGTPEPKACTC